MGRGCKGGRDSTNEVGWFLAVYVKISVGKGKATIIDF